MEGGVGWAWDGKETGTAELKELGAKVENPGAGVDKNVATRQQGRGAISDIEIPGKGGTHRPEASVGIIDRSVGGCAGSEYRSIRPQDSRTNLRNDPHPPVGGQLDNCTACAYPFSPFGIVGLRV